jgi:hypothetical protein
MSYKAELMHAQDDKRGVAHLIADDLLREDASPDDSISSDQIRAIFAKSLGVVLHITRYSDHAQELVIAAILSNSNPQAVKKAIKDYWTS